jgi:serine/threonine-protein kinase BUR1
MPLSCVFGEMFKGKPILTGNSDLNQAQLIFSLVGTPTEENMPGWSQLPGCEGMKNFGYKRSNLQEFFREYVFYPKGWAFCLLLLTNTDVFIG